MTNMAFMRQLMGLTQTEAARHLKIARGTYNRIEKLERPLSADIAARASKFYKISADKLLDEFDIEAFMKRSRIPTGFLADLADSSNDVIQDAWDFLKFLNAEADHDES